MAIHVSSKKTEDRKEFFSEQENTCLSLVWRFLDTFRKKGLPNHKRTQGRELDEEFVSRITYPSKGRQYIQSRKALSYPAEPKELAEIAAMLDMTIEDRELLVELWLEDNKRIMKIPRKDGTMRRRPVFKGNPDAVFEQVMNAELSEFITVGPTHSQDNAQQEREDTHMSKQKDEVRVLLDWTDLEDNRNSTSFAGRVLDFAYLAGVYSIENFASSFGLSLEWFNDVFYEQDQTQKWEKRIIKELTKGICRDAVGQWLRDGECGTPFDVILSEFRAGIRPPKESASLKTNGSSGS